MKFDDLEVGKEYADQFRRQVRVIGKTAHYVALEMLGDEFQPFRFMQHDCDYRNWRSYTPPPAPVTIFAYATDTVGQWGVAADEVFASDDRWRVGPVVRVELPVDPDMLARVKGGAS